MILNILVLVVLTTSVVIVDAWGIAGHRATAAVARSLLTPAARTAINAIVAIPFESHDTNPRRPARNYATFEDLAVWPDDVRRFVPLFRFADRYHALNYDDDPTTHRCGANVSASLPRECDGPNRKLCVVTAIDHFARELAAIIHRSSSPKFLHQQLQQQQDKQVMRPPPPPIEAKYALAFLTHFIGDVHQPLHVSGYKRGGQQMPVEFRNKKSHVSLHGVWDTLAPQLLIARDYDGNELQWHMDLERRALVIVSQQQQQSLCDDGDKDPTECFQQSIHLMGDDVRTSAETWARESEVLVCSVVYTDEIQPGAQTAGAYFDASKEVISDQVAKASVRLAAVLNGIFTTSAHVV
ncbi:S1/P1 nuclease [Blastocladiella britannica]|nr:S1/P1 nuclease [Blastocladiella britannica]